MEFSHLGELAALGTAFCWTITSLAFESAGKRIGSLCVNLIRLVMALGFLTVACYLFRGIAFPTDATSHAWGWLTLSGLVGFTLGDLCLFRAFVLVGSRLSMLMMALVPPFTAILSGFFLGENLAPTDWLGMALTVGGVVWVVAERPSNVDEPTQKRALGILLGGLAALGQASSLVLSKIGMGDYNPFAATQIRVIAGIAGFACLFVFIGWWPKVFKALSDKPAMARTALGGVFGPFLGVSLSLLAIQNTQAGVASTIMALVPVLIIAPSVLIKKERVTVRAIVGSVVAVGGAAILFL
jgi:drug/metabolite transporter (DMT)-like permease